jgi:hypothetical protein
MRTLIAVLLLASPIYAQSCQSFNFSPNPYVENIRDTTTHIAGAHNYSGTISGSCSYAGTDSTGLYGSCITTSTVTPTSNESEEFGGLVTSSTHVTASNTSNSQQAVSNGGSASATGAGVGAVKACFLGICSFSVSVTVNPVTFNFNGADIYTHGQSQILSCQARTGVAPLDPPPCRVIMTCDDGFAFDSTPGICDCEPATPILIDLENTGFHLTSAADGVVFDFTGNGHPRRFGWTEANSKTAFLVLDRDWNGVVDNGRELFGNVTPQPPSRLRNGFVALAEFDKPENGGNGDGVIDAKDNVFSMLRLWIDANHDGVSQPEELQKLASFDIIAFELNFTESRRVDEFGNSFRYRALVRTSDGGNRLAWDVLLATK